MQNYPPLKLEEFSKLLTIFPDFTQVAVALSGGIDSICLTLLLKEWADQNKKHLVALTVDHGLRLDSTKEAETVHRWMEQQNIEHHILKWQHPKLTARLQEQARQARYALMLHWCQLHNFPVLCLAHHANDQAETFLFRLCRGSGLDGLAAMAPVVKKKEIYLLRPLLSIPQARLFATVKQKNHPWIDDPSNKDPKFTRSRIRQIQKSLETEGLSLERLTTTIKRLGASRDALKQDMAAFLIRYLVHHPQGYGALPRAALREISQDVAWRVLAYLLMRYGGKIYPPRFNTLQRLYQDLIYEERWKTKTCWGCLIKPTSEGKIIFLREPSNIQEQIFIENSEQCQENSLYWDKRFIIKIEPKCQIKTQLTLKALGLKGWQQYRSMICETDHLPPVKEIIMSFPTFWENERLIAVPHLPYYKGSHILSKKEVKELTFLSAIDQTQLAFTNA